MRIAHLTSAHPRGDARIFHKECCTLSAAGHEVHLLVADGLGDSEQHNVQIHDVGRSGKGRSSRMLGATWRLCKKAKALRPDLVHIHDPELLPVLLLLKSKGIRALYDAHEDLPRQILSKHWIPNWLRPLVSSTVEVIENYMTRRADAVVSPTALIRQRFETLGVRVAEVRNYPILQDFGGSSSWETRASELCYVGALSHARGLVALVNAMEGLDVTLNLAGCCNEPGFREELQALPGWARVKDRGLLDRPAVAGLMQRCKIGIVTLLPVQNYVEALPVKLFEYMASGLPVIASDFPLWREIVESADCGLLVDPEDPVAIREAVKYLLGHDEEAKAMGSRGREAVLANYLWESQGMVLNKLVAEIKES